MRERIVAFVDAGKRRDKACGRRR